MSNQIGESFYLYGLCIPDGASPFHAIVPFASTQIKWYQNFMNRLIGMTYPNPKGENLPNIMPPMWAHRWRLKTTFQKNKRGEYYGWNLTLAIKKPDGSEDDKLKSLIRMNTPLYAAGRQFWEQIKSGKAKADYARADDGVAAGDDADSIPM